jgi:hypothetical protein
MDLRLHLLDTFVAQGSDGSRYKVCAYERLTRDPSFPQSDDHWESTGVTEYHLEDGRLVDVRADGSMQVAGTGLKLQQVDAAAH